ncbi:DNA-binding transcriptional regulator, LysR family [Pseudobutyrivibrio sp. YE44]|uniref:LysR family transcriptional regulator n=1 Tax=Pseudobutyrivibrio sp. YE44 TaxID=1520802 RepID=UPI0008828510|nr:LysR family transcriptional regulator [Pseudobutyrivibrio sp. YE44]SDB34062.1 DNA-binding transcriptional regulator, LysR family [Pseudobutyrivibrio sp. YE44]
MDIKDVRSFMECYETRSINKAARSLFITPQGLGKILDRLEHEMQVKLFERTKQGLVPTEAGVFFYEKGLKLLAETQELEQGLESIRKKNDIFKVGYSCGLIRMLPMKKIEQYQKFLGRTELVLEEGSNPDIKEKLINGQFDVALVIGRVAATGFIEQEIDSKSMCAVVSDGHKFFARESLSISDLKDEALISLNEKYQSYANLINSCEREGFYPDVRIKTMEAAMIYEFVREGLGIGIDVDIHNKEAISKDIKLIPIEDGISWNVYIAYEKSKEDDKKLQQFVKILISK